MDDIRQKTPEEIKQHQDVRKSKFRIFTYFELRRILPWLILAGLILIPDKSSLTVMFAIGIVATCTVMAHLIRKTFFPYLDLRELCESAAKDPNAAAKIVMALFFLNGVIIWAVISLLR